MDDPILSIGYVLYRSDGVEETLLDTGTRVLNTDEHDRRIEWCSQRGEYYAGIVAARAALDYSNEPFVLHLDAETVVEDIKNNHDRFEPYFRHALFSFLPRFREYYVRNVHRSNNESAHEQARVGLKIGRDIQQGVL